MREVGISDEREEMAKMSSREEKNKKRSERKKLKERREERGRSSCRETEGRSLEDWASERAKERLRKGEKANGVGNKERERGREGERKRTESIIARGRE